MLITIHGIAIGLGWLIARDWLGGVGIAVLLLCWHLVRVPHGPPVLFLALAFQWTQATIGLYYYGVTGRMVNAMLFSDYRPMVLLALGCVASLALGLSLGIRFVKARFPGRPIDRMLFSGSTLFAIYIAATAMTGAVQQVAWNYPLFTQAIIAVTYMRLGLVYLLLRRFVSPTPQFVRLSALIGFEVVLGFTGFFASFREPIILAAIALAEAFDARKTRHWLAVAGVLVLGLVAAVMWMGVRSKYRQDFFDVEMFSETRSMRIERMQTLASEWYRSDAQDLLYDVDFLIERLWAVYYPALAVARVPAVLPHTEGTILGGALRHIATPRVLFPDKAALPSDSEMVRKYSGIWVAGAESNTSIAFGYAAESYVDFGVPVMFLPVLVWGCFLGVAYQAVLVIIRHRELATPLLTVVFWLGVFLFERSWIKWMGLVGTLLIYAGGVTYLVDRWLLQQAPRVLERPSFAPFASTGLRGGHGLRGG